MENKVIEQFKGFLNTFPLWEGSGPFGIEQFHLPSHSYPIPQENEILNEISSLSHNFVLGKRMESFFSYMIRSSSSYRLIAENIQIVSEKITIGEIDFLVEDKNNEEIFHIEMVYKFYVYDPSFKIEEERWIGPNRRDSLLQKIRKLKEHQLPLLTHPVTSGILRSLNIDNRAINQQVCFKAHLFLPRDMAGKSFPLFNNFCLSGFWIHLREFRPEEFSDHLFFAPKKQDWPINPESNSEWIFFAMIYAKVVELHNKEISPLLWMKTSTGEIERLFVVWW